MRSAPGQQGKMMSEYETLWIVKGPDGTLYRGHPGVTEKMAIHEHLIYGAGQQHLDTRKGWEQWQALGYEAAEFQLVPMPSRPVRQGRKPGAKTSKGLVRHPDRHDLIWSGRGRRPAWLHELLCDGRQIEDLRD